MAIILPAIITLWVSGSPEAATMGVSLSSCHVNTCEVNERVEALSTRLATLPRQEKEIEHLGVRLDVLEDELKTTKFGDKNVEKQIKSLREEVAEMQREMKRERNELVETKRDLDKYKRTAENVRLKVATMEPIFGIPEEGTTDSPTARRENFNQLLFKIVGDAISSVFQPFAKKMQQLENQMRWFNETLMRHNNLDVMFTDDERNKTKEGEQFGTKNVNETQLIDKMDSLRVEVNRVGHSVAALKESMLRKGQNRKKILDTEVVLSREILKLQGNLSHVQGLLEQYEKEFQQLHRIMNSMARKQNLLSVLDANSLLEACYHEVPEASGVTSEVKGQPPTSSSMMVTSGTEVVFRCSNSEWFMKGSAVRRCWNGTWTTSAPPTCSPSSNILETEPSVVKDESIESPSPAVLEKAAANPCFPDKTGNIPHPLDCTKFHQCQEGSLIQTLDCDPRTYFNATLNKCEWIEGGQECP